ncbi:hypothetical protein ABZP36_000513 [Zizania latifolia]
MTVTPQITVSDGRLAVRGRTVLTGVPDNVAAAHVSMAGLVDGAFVGAAAGEGKSLHVFTFGTLRDCRFMCLFRFKLWWMTQRMGSSGRDVPLETQFMIIEVPASSSAAAGDVSDADGGEPVYVVMLPLLEGQFRAALQGNDRDELQICIESGDTAVQTEQGTNMVYIHAGTNPFHTITQAVKAVEKHMQTFHHREKKKLPSFLDWFGWCTWDAFYTDVTADGVKQGLRSFATGGTPPRFLIIDDGWQQIGSENKDDSAVAVQEGAQFASRLTGIKENIKFQNKKKTEGAGAGDGEGDGETPGLKLLLDEVKGEHGVRQVYVWHAMAGYWGGVTPAAKGMERYEAALAYPVQSPGVTGNQPDIVMDSLSVLGLGLVHPRRAHAFYGELHSYLASCGVDGVKVDVQNIIETLGAGHGGRVALTRAYHRALEASVARSFPDNGCISCMCHNTDMLYSARQTAVPGNHNFELLRKLVLPDGSVLRARLPGRPTRDCLFSDPARDGASLLKIWNLNKCGGVVGLFNCQGAGWCRVAKKTRVHDAAPGTLTGTVRADDVDAIAQVAGGAGEGGWDGEAVVYAHRAGELVRLPRGAALPVTLGALEYEVFHVCPLRAAPPGVSFAPVGLLDMFNAGGAVDECAVNDNGAAAAVVLRVRGCGRFGAYFSRRPSRCALDSADVEFSYDGDTGLVTIDLPVPDKELYMWTLEIHV